MRYTIWYGESEEAARFVEQLSGLRALKPAVAQMWPTGNDFVRNPRALQQILYLDRPDVVVTQGDPEKPILAVEFCAEAPSGHNICQRLARAAAAAEFGIPFAFVFPRRKWIIRQVRGQSQGRWDEYNPLPLKALAQMSRFHRTPVMAFFWDADEKKGRVQDGYLLYDSRYAGMPRRTDPEIKAFAAFAKRVIEAAAERRPAAELAFDPVCLDRENEMQKAYWTRVVEQGQQWSPLTNTNEMDTSPALVDYLSGHLDLSVALPEHLLGRKRSLVYAPEVTTFRADPYAGNLVALDYHECRYGPTPDHRHKNLVLHLPQVSIESAADKFMSYHRNRCPFRAGAYGPADRYLTLHLREGCRYTKQKELRVFCYLADLVVFQDAVLM